MTTPHKHSAVIKHKHSAVIKQWADGVPIEFKNDSTRNKWTRFVENACPAWLTDTEYRVYDKFRKLKDLYYNEGSLIQFEDADGIWEDIETPSWFDNYNYRVKPSSDHQKVLMTLAPHTSRHTNVDDVILCHYIDGFLTTVDVVVNI